MCFKTLDGDILNPYITNTKINIYIIDITYKTGT